MKTRSDHDFRMLALFVVVGLICYSSILASFFLSDDFAQIGKVLNGDWAVTWGLADGGGFFRPLFILSYIVDSKIWGTNPFGYHLTNVLLHALNAYLVFLLSVRLLRADDQNQTASLRISVAAGLFFLLLPSHTEAVTWISGRADLIATLFFLASLICYDSYKPKRNSRYLAASLILFLLALLAKESALCLPLIVVVLELQSSAARKQKLEVRRVVTTGLLFTGTAVVYLLIRYVAIGTFVGVYGASHHLNFNFSLIWERLPKYTVRAFLPPLPDQLSFMLVKPFKSRSFLVIALLSIASLSALVIWRHRSKSSTRRRQENAMLLLLAVCFLFSLLPVITMGISVFETTGERFVYLPTAFTSILLAYILAVFINHRRVWLLAVGYLLIFYSVSLWRSNQKWWEASQLSTTIFTDIVSLSNDKDILVLNAPDNLNGVPVYRNSLESLATFTGGKRIGRIDVVATHSVRSINGVSLSRFERNLFEIRLINQKDDFTRVGNVACVEIKEQTRNLLRLQLQDCALGKDVFYFENGRMVKISPR